MMRGVVPVLRRKSQHQFLLFYDIFWNGILGHQFNKRLESFAPCYSQSLLQADFEEKLTLLWLKKIPYKKFAKQKNSSLFMIAFCRTEKVRVTTRQKNLVWEDSSLFPETSTKNADQICEKYIHGLSRRRLLSSIDRFLWKSRDLVFWIHNEYWQVLYIVILYTCTRIHNASKSCISYSQYT